MSFAALRNKSKNSTEKLAKKIDDDQSGGFAKDPRFWTMTVDKAGVGEAVIRFLCEPEGEDYPYVRRYEHFIKANGAIYAEHSRTTLKGEKDPVTEYFFEMRGDNPTKEIKDKYSPFSRRANYIANIYVVSDPANPENEGKVFLYKFGNTIFEYLQNCIKPKFASEKAFNPFDLWEGANFVIRAYNNKGGQRQYDKSSFEACGPLLDNDDDLESVYNDLYKLTPEIAPEVFKSYEELETIFNKFLNAKPKGGRSTRGGDDDGGSDDRSERRSSRSRGRDEDGDDGGADERTERRSSRPARSEPEAEPEKTERRSSRPSRDAEPEPEASDNGGGEKKDSRGKFDKYKALLSDD